MSFIITFLASISTILGSIIVFKFKDISKITSLLFSFVSGIILCVCVLDLIPTSFSMIIKSYSLLNTILIVLVSFSIGYILVIILNQNVNNTNKLYKVGIIAMISIIIHNIPEGILTYITATNDLKIGIKLAIIIALHNIPEGILIALPIYLSTKSKSRAIIFTSIAGMSEFFGALIAHYFLGNMLLNNLGILYSFVSGIMINLILIEIIPYIKHNSNFNRKLAYLFFIFGITFILIMNIVLH